MGFRPEPTIYNLKFDGTALDGLQARMSCCTIAETDDMLRTAVKEGDINEDTLKDNDRILDLFVNHLVSWNLEDLAGQPVPTTREGINSQERGLIAQLIAAWQIAMSTVPNLSPPESSSGETSEEASLGLGSSSTNLGS
jgi:hypothetical protein